jgi:hypothetical protein
MTRIKNRATMVDIIDVINTTFDFMNKFIIRY